MSVVHGDVHAAVNAAEMMNWTDPRLMKHDNGVLRHRELRMRAVEASMRLETGFRDLSVILADAAEILAFVNGDAK